MSSTEILNFVRIDDRIATAGQPTKAQLEDMKAEGYQAVVNLLPQIQDNALKGEDKIVRALGMDYHYIPVVWTDPKPQDFETFCAVMSGLSDQKVLIHCAMNLRVTAFFSAYAVKHLDWSSAQADKLVARVWDQYPRYGDDPTWRAFNAAMRR